MSGKIDKDIEAIRKRAGLTESPAFAAQDTSKNFEPLDISDMREFGERYGQQIHKVVSDSEIGNYVGYAFSLKDKLIEIIGTKGIVTINYSMHPLAVKTVFR